MGPMKDGPNTVERDSHPRSGSFYNFSAGRLEQGLDFPPGDIRPDRIFEYRLKC